MQKSIEAYDKYQTLAAVAVVCGNVPTVYRSGDLGGNFLLAMAEVGDTDYLVTGNRRDLLGMKRHGRAKIVEVKVFLKILGLASP